MFHKIFFSSLSKILNTFFNLHLVSKLIINSVFVFIFGIFFTIILQTNLLNPSDFLLVNAV